MTTRSRTRNPTSRKTVIAVAIGAIALALAACNTTKVGFDYETRVARFVLESENQGSIVALPISGVRIQVNPKAILTEYDIEAVDVAELELGACLQFTLSHRASRDFYQKSATNLGKRLVLLVNGKAVGLQRLERPIGNGVIYIFVEIPDSELPELAKNLRGTSIELQNKING